MKMFVRVLSVVLAVLLAFPGAAFAEEDNDYLLILDQLSRLDDFSTDQLLKLKTQIEVVLAGRNDIDKAVSVPSGIYTVGQDIPHETFTIICEDTVASVKVIDRKGVTILSETLYKGERLGRIDLHLDYKVQIHGGTVIFTKYKGLGF